MDYAQRQRNPGKHLAGIAVVIVFHVLLGWALVSGLATKVIEVVKGPMDTKIIEEIKKPPPPDVPPPPPPKMVQVMPTFVPPPEVQIQQPVAIPVISNPTPVAPPVYAPPAPPVQAAPVSAQPAIGVACPNFRETMQQEFKYPPQARKDGISGEVLLEFTVAANGEIKDVEVKSSTNRVFNNVSVNTVKKFRCLGQGRDVKVQVPIVYKLTD